MEYNYYIDLRSHTIPFALKKCSTLFDCSYTEENIFLYHMILAAFKVPANMSRFALLVVSLFQMVFQMPLGRFDPNFSDRQSSNRIGNGLRTG